MSQSIYENRAVLFLDILGFASLVNAGRESEIFEVLQISQDIKRCYPFDKPGDMEISAFSDSIIVSAKVEDGAGVAKIVHYAGYLAWKYLNLGILTRGGVAVGKMHHKDGVAFGPALLMAYDLESKLAIFPRVLTSSDVHNQYIEYEVITRAGLSEMMRTVLREDLDMQVHINLMSDWCAGQPDSFMPNKPATNGVTSYTGTEILLAKKTCIYSAIDKNTSSDARHLVKLGWLKKYVDSF
jgi:hypothetical protein